MVRGFLEERAAKLRNHALLLCRKRGAAIRDFVDWVSSASLQATRSPAPTVWLTIKASSASSRARRRVRLFLLFPRATRCRPRTPIPILLRWPGCARLASSRLPGRPSLRSNRLFGGWAATLWPGARRRGPHPTEDGLWLQSPALRPTERRDESPGDAPGEPVRWPR